MYPVPTTRVPQTQEELANYAEDIGIDLAKYPDLVWLAMEGFKAPPPDGWKLMLDQQSGKEYYFNFDTGTSSWSHPADELYRKRAAEEVAKMEQTTAAPDSADTTGDSTGAAAGMAPGTVRPSMDIPHQELLTSPHKPKGPEKRLPTRESAGARGAKPEVDDFGLTADNYDDDEFDDDDDEGTEEISDEVIGEDAISEQTMSEKGDGCATATPQRLPEGQDVYDQRKQSIINAAATAAKIVESGSSTGNRTNQTTVQNRPTAKDPLEDGRAQPVATTPTAARDQSPGTQDRLAAALDAERVAKRKLAETSDRLQAQLVRH